MTKKLSQLEEQLKNETKSYEAKIKDLETKLASLVIEKNKPNIN